MNQPWRLPRLLALVAGAACALGAPSDCRADLHIEGTFEGGRAPSNMVGGNNLESIFRTAASIWERAYAADPRDHWVVHIRYHWGPLGEGTNAHYDLERQGGDPNRVQAISVTFNNSGSRAFFADPTPLDNSEYREYYETTYNTDQGPLVTGRLFTGATGKASDRVDLLTVALHEIGHGLGLSAGNKAVTGDIVIQAPLPYAGTFVSTFGSEHLWVGEALMNTAQDPGTRHLVSPVDILVDAQISQFARPNLDPYAVRKPGPPRPPKPGPKPPRP